MDTSALASDPHQSAWVSANAGAGKTYLLTDRVTRLLLSGAHPSRILCLTYTKAAAAEMASRLFQRLGEWALLPDKMLIARLNEIGAGAPNAEQLRRARTLFAQALETPGGLKIQTIHSFCQHVLSRFPVEAGIPARFSVLDERSAAELMANARSAVLERAAKGEATLAQAVATLAARAADGRFAEILNFAVGESGKLRALLALHEDEAGFFAHLRTTLGVKEGEDEAGVTAEFCKALEKDAFLLTLLPARLLAGTAGDRETGSKMLAFVDARMGPDGYEHLRKAVLTADGGPRKRLMTKKLADEQPELCTFFESLRDRVIAGEERRKAALIASLTEALVTVAIAVLATYDALKRDRAALDYDDLTAQTLALLERRDAALWVLYKLDGGLDHILVDEAQDTSPEQWRIVAKLAEEFFAGKGAREFARVRTLFAVGDEKQSIFSFQGADPAEFGRHRAIFKARAESATLAFSDLRPAISRRSARTILEFVDALFANDAARDGLTSSDDPIHHDPHRKEPGRVEIWPAVKAPENPAPDPWDQPVDAPSRRGAPAILAQRIATRIAGWLADGATLPGSDVAIQPKDIMILVRRRNFFAEEMIRQLVERGVAVAGADRMVLMDQIAIADLVALGRFALLPDDDLVLAALLKSPLIGFPEEELFDLAQPRGGSLWAELRERAGERESFTGAHAMLSEALARADFLPPFEFYARALGKGLRKRLVARLGEEAADAIDEFLALALAHEGSHPPSLQSFLDWFEKSASDVKRDMEHGGGAVRVMTVHGAKGLEANIVILPDTAQVPDHERRSGLLYTDDCAFYGVAKPLEAPPVTAAKAAARARELKEYRRLLYVAATRAREWLIVCGYETQRGVHDDSWYPLLEAAGRGLGRLETIEGETVLAVGAAIARTTQPSLRLDGARTRVPEFLRAPPPPEPALPQILRPSDAAGLEEPALLSPIAEAGQRFRRGLLVHALLAHLPDIAIAEREHVALAYLARRGIDANEAKLLAGEALAILSHPKFAALFADGSRAEVAITAELPQLGNVRISGQIDRLAVTRDAVLIADFKTNRPPPASAKETPRLYLSQMALYRAGLQRIYPGRRVDCALVWTDGGVLMELPANLLDAELGKIADRKICQESSP